MTDETPIDPMSEAMARCEAAIDYRFTDRNLLRLCLTHASVARTRFESNERLEFLGDAIMGAAVCEQLYRLYPTKPEGELTRIKSVIVARTTCSRISSELGLDRCVQLGKGLVGTEQIPNSIMAAVFESLVAGVFLDSGFDTAKQLVQRLMAPEIDRTVETSHGKNYKSLLQQQVQKQTKVTPVYRLVAQSGPDHSKSFLIGVQIGDEHFPPATGQNKKEAEQKAAEIAWNQLRSRANSNGDGKTTPSGSTVPAQSKPTDLEPHQVLQRTESPSPNNPVVVDSPIATDSTPTASTSPDEVTTDGSTAVIESTAPPTEQHDPSPQSMEADWTCFR